MSVTRGNVAQRRCRVCRTVRPKAQLTRYVIQDQQLVVDPTATLPGRGYYHCHQPRCIERFALTVKGIKRS